MIIRQAVQLIYTSSPRNVPDLLRGSWTILGINIPRWRLVLALLAVAPRHRDLVAAGAHQFRAQGPRRGRQPRPCGERPASMSGRCVPGCSPSAPPSPGSPAVSLAPVSTLDPQYGLLFMVNAFPGHHPWGTRIVDRFGGGGGGPRWIAGAAAVRHSHRLRPDIGSGDRGRGCPASTCRGCGAWQSGGRTAPPIAAE